MIGKISYEATTSTLRESPYFVFPIKTWNFFSIIYGMLKGQQINMHEEKHDFSVWWDDALKAGEDWHDRILREVRIARCLVGVWSDQSVTNDRVFVPSALNGHNYLRIEHEEAGHAKIAGARFSSHAIPMLYSELQSADLSDWDGVDSSHKGILDLLQCVEEKATPLFVRRRFQEIRYDLDWEREKRRASDHNREVADKRARDQLKDALAIEQELKAARIEWDLERQTLQSQISKLEVSKSAIETSLERVRMQLSGNQESDAQIQARIVAFETRATEAEETSRQLNLELERVQGELGRNLEKSELLKRDLLAEREKTRNLDELSAQTQDETLNLNRRIHQLENDRIALEEEVQKHTTISERLERDHLERLSQINRERNALMDDVNNSARDTVEMKSRISRLEYEIESASTLLSERAHQLTTQTQLTASLQAELAESSIELKRKMSESAMLGFEVRKLGTKASRAMVWAGVAGAIAMTCLVYIAWLHGFLSLI